jgi:hypothetical protein
MKNVCYHNVFLIFEQRLPMFENSGMWQLCGGVEFTCPHRRHFEHLFSIFRQRTKLY